MHHAEELHHELLHATAKWLRENMVAEGSPMRPGGSAAELSPRTEELQHHRKDTIAVCRSLRFEAIRTATAWPPRFARETSPVPRGGRRFSFRSLTVTALTRTNRPVVHFFYNQRMTAEQWIKEGKTAIHWTRLSCHRFRANEVRLLLGVIAYNLGNLLRRRPAGAIQSWSLTSLQQPLFKAGG